MRILVVSQYFWPETFRITDVVTLLQAAGCEITVLTGQPNYPGGRTFDGYCWTRTGWDKTTEYSIARVPLVPRGSKNAFGLTLNYLSFAFFGSIFGPWLLRGRRYDVIFVYAPSPILQAIPAILLKWIKRAPLVVWVQDLWPESLEVTGYVKSRTALRLVGTVTRWIYQRSDLLLGQSRSFVEAIKQMAPSAHVEYYPTPGDIAPKTSASRPALSLPDGFNVVFAGNLGTAQALPTILEAAVILRDRKDIRFTLVGDGSQMEWLEQQIAQHGLDSIALPGRFPSNTIPGVLAQASALLVTLNRSDAMAKTIPAKISTYLAAGRPIIASIDGEGRRVLTEAGAGIACAAEDSAALSAAILQLAATNPELRERMGHAGRMYFEANFEPQMLAQRLIGLFNEAIVRVKGNRA